MSNVTAALENVMLQVVNVGPSIMLFNYSQSFVTYSFGVYSHPDAEVNFGYRALEIVGWNTN